MLLLLALVATIVGASADRDAYFGTKGGHGSQGIYNSTNNRALYGNTEPIKFTPSDIVFSDSRRNLETEAGVGVCFVEVPTASLVGNPSQVPAGNGSRPDLSRIRSCCAGYTRNIYNHLLCDPVCSKGCHNANCVAPETCTCFPDHVKNAADFCVATCPIGCQNGLCVGSMCRCHDGFTLEVYGKYCVPKCDNNCGGSGILNCTAPNTCTCKPGYTSGPSGSCRQSSSYNPLQNNLYNQNQANSTNNQYPYNQYQGNPTNKPLYPNLNQGNFSNNPYYPNQNGQNLYGQYPYQNGQYPNGPYPNQNGQNPNGPNQNGQNSSGQHYPNHNGQYPNGQYNPNQNGQNPNGPYSNQNGQHPNGQYIILVRDPNKNGQYPNGQYNPNQNGQTPSGPQQHPNGQHPNGQYNILVRDPNQNGQYPNGQYNPNQNGQTPSGPYPNQNGQYPNGQYNPNQNGQNPNGQYSNPNGQNPNQNNPYITTDIHHQRNFSSDSLTTSQVNVGFSNHSMNLSSYPNQGNQNYQPGQYPGQNPGQYPGQYPAQNQYNPNQYSHQYWEQIPTDQNVNEDLVPRCSQPCINGVCVPGNRCSCNPRYELDSTDPSGTRCRPRCSGGCQNGVCSAPNFCICDVGYRKEQGVKGGAARCIKRLRRSILDILL